MMGYTYLRKETREFFPYMSLTLSERFKQMEQIRKKKQQTQNKKSQDIAVKIAPKVTTKVTKKDGVANRLGPKKQSIEQRLGKTVMERLGKTVEERLGKRLPKGTVVVGDHILGPKPKQTTMKGSKKTRKV
jgi:uncharacterized HAD superfamily protein